MTDAPEYADPERYIDLAGFQGTWRDLFWNPDFLDLTARRLRLRDARDALDVGCGAGHWGCALFPHLHRDARLVGVDREVAFLDLARKAAEPGRTSFVKGEADALPFPDASFDLVTCQLVLIHVREPRRALAEMRRVLRPDGVLLAAEPDNRAGNLALLGGDPRPSDDDILLITELLLRCDRGKLALGEGDQSIGGRLPGLLVDAGLDEVVAYTNDRCVSLYPPYDRADMRVQLEQEFAWSREDVSLLCGSRPDNLRFFKAGDGDPERFDLCWAAVRRWMNLVRAAVERGAYRAARGFVMYLAAGRKPR
ncbi:MAG TPA: class I SAM-dependent methyltransferase [Polyangiaceae bacterium]|nr:class I SAM-dependent methyltransferase [Polyangiaceae bacterium]